MSKKTLLFSFIASMVLTFILSFIGKYVKMVNARREFQTALRNYQEKPTIRLIEVGYFPRKFTPSKTHLVEQTK